MFYGCHIWSQEQLKLWLRSQRSKKGRISQTDVTCDCVQICFRSSSYSFTRPVNGMAQIQWIPYNVYVFGFFFPYVCGQIFCGIKSQNTLLFSEGQNIAKRLTKNLQRTSKCIKKSINEYNKNGFTNRAGNLPDELSWNDVCDPLAKIYQDVQCNSQATVSIHLFFW